MLKIASVLVLALVLVQSTQSKGTINVKVVLPNKIQNRVSEIDNSLMQDKMNQIPTTAISFLEAERSVDVSKLSEQSLEVWSQKSLEIENEPEKAIEQIESVQNESYDDVNLKKKISIKVDKKESNTAAKEVIKPALKKFSVAVGKINKESEKTETNQRAIEQEDQVFPQKEESKGATEILEENEYQSASSNIDSQELNQSSKLMPEEKPEKTQKLITDAVPENVEASVKLEQSVEEVSKIENNVKVADSQINSVKPQEDAKQIGTISEEAKGVESKIDSEVVLKVEGQPDESIAKENIVGNTEQSNEKAPIINAKPIIEEIPNEIRINEQEETKAEVQEEVQQSNLETDNLPQTKDQAVSKLSSENKIEQSLDSNEEELIIQDIKVEAVAKPELEKDETQLVIKSDEEIKVNPVVPEILNSSSNDSGSQPDLQQVSEIKQSKPLSEPLVASKPDSTNLSDEVAGKKEALLNSTENLSADGNSGSDVDGTTTGEEQVISEEGNQGCQGEEQDSIGSSQTDESNHENQEESSHEEQSNEEQSQEEQKHEESHSEENQVNHSSEEDASPVNDDQEIQQQPQIQEAKKQLKAESPEFMVKKNQLTKKLKNIAESMKQDDKPVENTLFSLNVSNLNPDEEVIIIKDSSQFDRDVQTLQTENEINTIPDQQFIGEVVQVQAEVEKVDLSIFQNDGSDLIPIIVEDSETQSEIVTESIKDVTEKELEIIKDSSQQLISDKIDGVSNHINRKNIIQDDYQLDYDQLETDVVVNKVLQNDGNSFEDFQSQLDELSDQLDELQFQATAPKNQQSDDQQYLTIQTNNEQVVQSSSEDDYYFEDLDNELDQIIQQQAQISEQKSQEKKQEDVVQQKQQSEPQVINEKVEAKIDEDFSINEQENVNVEQNSENTNRNGEQNQNLEELDDDYLEVEQPSINEETQEQEISEFQDDQIQNTNDGLVIDKGDYQEIYDSHNSNIDTTDDYDFEFQVDSNNEQDIVTEQQVIQQVEQKVVEKATPEVEVITPIVNQTEDIKQEQSQDIQDQQEETIQKQIQEQTEEQENEIALDSSEDIQQQDDSPKIIKKKQLIKKEVIAPQKEQENVISTDDINANGNEQEDVVEVFQDINQKKSQDNKSEDQIPEVIENLEDLKDCIENDQDEHTVQGDKEEEQKNEETQQQKKHKLSLKVDQPNQQKEEKSFTLESNDKQSKFEQQLHQQIINKKQKEKQQLSHEEQFEQVVNELINGLESLTDQRVENREQEKVISQKIKQDVQELKKIHGIEEPIKQKTENCEKEPQSVDDYIEEYYKNKEFQQKVEDLMKSQPKSEDPKIQSDRYYLDKNKPVNQAVSDYEKELDQRRQEVLEKIKNDLQVKKGRFQSNQKADNLSPYEFERIYLDWQKNKQDIVSSMLQHASSAEQPQEVSQEPVAKVERVSKKDEVEQEIKELFQNYKGKRMRGIIINMLDENQESEKYSFLSVNQKVKQNLRRNKQ